MQWGRGQGLGEAGLTWCLALLLLFPLLKLGPQGRPPRRAALLWLRLQLMSSSARCLQVSRSQSWEAR